MNRIQVSTTVAAALALPLLASAAGSSVTIESIGLGIVRALWIVFTVIAVIAFVVAGIKFLTSGGEPDKVAEARAAVVWGIVGIIVALLAYGAITLVKSIIGA